MTSSEQQQDDIGGNPPGNANGRSKLPTGGAAAAHGLLGRSGLVDRHQFVRLLEQCLSDLGFAKLAAQLERASGIARQPPQVNELQASVLAGDWAAAAKHVGRLELPSHAALQEAKFVILEQAFLEALQAGQAGTALACLRDQLAPLGVNPARLHQLAACIMGSGGGDSGGLALLDSSGSDSEGELEGEVGAGAAAAARRRVLRRLQAFIPPELMLPDRRLEELVEQALAAQISACRFHNSPGARPSLLTDYDCGTEQIPTCTTQVLLDHTDEVWHLAFSHDGCMLASCGKDQTAILWDVERAGPGSGGGRTVTRRHVLRGHTGPVAFLCWGPDSAQIATCGQDALRLWDTASGKCVAIFRHHTDPVTCAAWFPDGSRLATGSHDKQLCVISMAGEMEQQWRIQRIQEVLVAKGGRYLLATTCERKVRIYDLEAGTESHIPEGETLISMSLSHDGRYLLVNLASNTMHLWDLGPSPSEIRMPTMPCATYQGPSDKQSRFVVRSCLGGLDDRFVLTGSEECRVYVYHRHTGERLLALEGHSGTVNAVCWSPTDPQLFASASDDKSIHIWQPAAVAAAQGVSDGLQ